MSSPDQRQSFVSIGSNVDREQNVRAAVAALRGRFEQLSLSPVYESAAEGFDGAPFYNLVVMIYSAMSLAELRTTLRDIEHEIGRDRSGSRFGPRTIDLDLLTCGELIVQDGKLVLPRADILKYAFVLKPLADLAPDALHPELGTSYAELWRKYSGKAELRRVAMAW